MKKTMNMPGFTAQAALFNTKGHYQAAEEAATYSGTVQPARRPRDYGLPCLKFDFVCDDGPCHWETTLGHVGPFGCQ